MPQLRSLLLPLGAVPLLTSCIFLLDYDDLQSKAGNKGGADGAGGNGNGAMDAGGASGAATCGDCDDNDPCTIDTCDETGAAPACTHEATEGLKLDGFDATLSAERHVRVSLVGSGQLFYLASMQVDKGTPKVSLYRLAEDGTALEALGADLKLDGTPVSGVGLAIEELALGEVALHGFIATKARLANSTAKVFHVVNRDDKTMSNLVGASYKEGNDTVLPQALVIGDKIVGSWIQADSTIAVHNVGTAKTDTFGDAALPATTFSLLSSSDDQPAVMFTAQKEAKKALGTYVETAGQNRVKLQECETRPGDYLSSSVISTQLPGIWLANITRAGDGYLTNGSGTIVCTAASCVTASEDCSKATPSNGLRDVAGGTVRFDTDDPGLIYSVVAVPQIAVKPDDSTMIEGKLSLVLGRTDFSGAKAVSTTIGGDPTTGLIEIAHTDTSEAAGFAGPDWPAVSILKSQYVAVAWIQPNAAAPGTELHVQRYKMCLPNP